MIVVWIVNELKVRNFVCVFFKIVDWVIYFSGLLIVEN